MLNSVEIRNFQSIEKADIEFGRITVLNGPSNIGKSAIVRALKALVHNSFSKAFMREGASTCSVKLTEGDKWVKYLRGTSSKYISSSGEEYTKIGREVPDDIAGFLNMSKIQFDTDLEYDFNFQSQFDPPFLLDDSGFDIAKVFGKLMNIELVLSSAKEVSKDILALNRRYDVVKAMVAEINTYIDENKFIEDKYFALQEADLRFAKYEKDKQALDTLGNIISGLSCVEQEIGFIEKKKEELSKYEDWEFKGEELFNLISGLERVAGELEGLEVKHEALSVDFDTFDKIEPLGDLIVSLTRNSEFVSFMTKKLSLMDVEAIDVEGLKSLEDFIDEGTNLNSSYQLAFRYYKDVETSFTKLKQEFSDFLDANDICPLTKMKMSVECKEVLKGEFK